MYIVRTCSAHWKFSLKCRKKVKGESSVFLMDKINGLAIPGMQSTIFRKRVVKNERIQCSAIRDLPRHRPDKMNKPDPLNECMKPVL